VGLDTHFAVAFLSFSGSYLYPCQQVQWNWRYLAGLRVLRGSPEGRLSWRCNAEDSMMVFHPTWCPSPSFSALKEGDRFKIDAVLPVSSLDCFEFPPFGLSFAWFTVLDVGVQVRFLTPILFPMQQGIYLAILCTAWWTGSASPRHRTCSHRELGAILVFGTG
jgi:hypothetical protein